MGLNGQDKLIRGNLVIPDDDLFGRNGIFGKRCNYGHGWVEFTFKGREYVFDNHYETVIPKKIWYEIHEPEIHYTITLDELIGILNPSGANEVEVNGVNISNKYYMNYVYEKAILE